ncbi:MAG: DNA primase [Halobacteriovoraceae bacterium]|nr:DNA primase [Halobacteriovoraceae bacterium]
MALNDLKDIIKQISISEGISRYIDVEKKGRKHIATCPFHDDHDPSLQIDDDKSLFMCFVCQTGGDLITFVEKFKNLDFGDALKDLAEKFSIPFEEHFGQKMQSPRQEMAQKILHKASLIYKRYSEKGDPGTFHKFLKNRGLSDETAQNFKIGLAPSHNIIWNYLNSIPNTESKESALKMAIEIGLIRQNKENKSHYDTFRDRIIFPIWDHFGKVVGFGGRALHDYQKAKYLNSFDSFIFNKRNIAYGLHIAKSSIRQKDAVILTEGYLDTIALHQYGFSNSVAIMGVGLSEYMAQYLIGLTKNIYMALDSDKAGLMAMERVNQIFMQKGILPKYLNFTPFKDPDEYLAQKGAVGMCELIEKAKTFIDNSLERLLPNPIPSVSDQKILLLEMAFEILSPLKEQLSATERVVQFARSLEIRSTPEMILSHYREYLTKKTSKLNVNNDRPQREEQVVQGERVEKKEFKSLSTGEKLLIKQIILHPDIMQGSRFAEVLDLITNFEVKRYISSIEKLYYEVDETEFMNLLKGLHLNSETPAEIGEAVGAVLFQYRKEKRFTEEQEKKFFTDLIKRLKEDYLISQKKALKAQSSLCHTEREMKQLMNEIISIDKKLNELKTQKIETH